MKLLEKIISKIKGETYCFEDNIRAIDLISICFCRAIEIIRGTFLRIGLRKSGIVFCGKRVKIQHKQKISCGTNVYFGDNVYINALSTEGIRMGCNVTIARNAEIICSGVIRNVGVGIELGNNVAIGNGSKILAQGGVSIGDDTIMGPHVLICAENHVFEDKGKPIRLQGETRKGIFIGKNCWVGAGAIILDGVRIADNCVIGAGTIVTKDVEEDSLILGTSGKKVRKLYSQNEKKD